MLVAANNSGAVRNATITIGSTVVPVVQNVVSTCAFGVTPSAVAAGPAASGGTLTVTASDPACAWVAASDVPWLTFGATAGVGNSSLVYSLTENTGSAARWSGLTVGNQQVSVTQASSTALTIAGGTAPAANALGWHQQDVTVVFTCAGPGTIACADPVTVTDDGVHDITGQASNDLLDTASTTVTVRIDRVAPSLGVSFPRANSLVQAGAVTITGSVADALSTPSVVCDGVLATVSGGSFACTVSVGSGTTNVNVTAVDQAGNSRSQVVLVSTTDAIVTPPTNLRVSPQNVTMVVGERRRFAMLDDLDRAPVDVGWTRTNTTLSTLLITQGVAELTATAVGSTVLTATWRGLTSTTTVTIVAGSALVPGTTIWNAPPRSVGATVANVMKGAATPSGESYLYAVERGAVDTVRVFDVDGAERWSVGTGGQVTQLSGDALGGAVALVGSALTRLEPGGAAMPFASDVASPGFAIHPNGPVYYVHWTGTGYRLRGDDVGLGVGRSWDLPAEASQVGTPTVMPDGSVALPYTGPSFRLLIARQDGSTSTYELFSSPLQSSVIPYKAIPNGQGGYFVAYDDWGFNVNYYAATIVTVDSNGVPQTYATVGGTQHAFNSGTWFGWGSGRSHGTMVMGPLSPGGPDVLNVTYNAVQNGQWGVGVSDVTASGFPISDFWLPGVSQPTYLSSDAGFVVSFPTGPMGGPSPDYDLLTLTNPSVLSAGRWAGGAVGGGVANIAGPSFGFTGGAWPFAQGGSQGGNATGPLSIDNEASSTALVVKAETCEDGFFVVPAGQKRYGLWFDGIKPTPWSPDWYKVRSASFSRVGVQITATGMPSRFWAGGTPGFSLLPECDYGQSVCLGTYSSSGGRKKEPEWSSTRGDWRYPDPFLGNANGRRQACVTGQWP